MEPVASAMESDTFLSDDYGVREVCRVFRVYYHCELWTLVYYLHGWGPEDMYSIHPRHFDASGEALGNIAWLSFRSSSLFVLAP